MTTWAEVQRIIKFATVGLASTALYFLLLALLSGVVQSVILVTGLCYVLSMVFNYVLQSTVTFRTTAPLGTSVFRFSMMHVSAMLFNSLAMHWLVEGLGLPILAAQVPVTACLAVSTYLVSKHWVYQT